MDILSRSFDVAALAKAGGVALGAAAFGAGSAYMAMSAAIDGKADKTQFAVLLEREQLHHDEVMRGLADVKSEVHALQVSKQDKP